MRAALLGLCTLLAAADIAPEAARVQGARARAGPRVTRALAEARVPRPCALLLRVFKEERLLEVWASDRARNPGVPASALGGRPVVSQGRGRSAG